MIIVECPECGHPNDYDESATLQYCFECSNVFTATPDLLIEPNAYSYPVDSMPDRVIDEIAEDDDEEC